MKDVLHEIAIKLKKGEFKNESEISRGVVLRILSQLGWNHFDTSEISSEYSLGGRRVDYALFCGKKRPIVFIEVKQPGNTENADRQLFEYAFHEGIPLAVLTDGVTWSFYLPGEQGSYEDRRVYKLDLIERSAEEAVEKLIRYLRKDRIKTGDALTDARSDYNNKSRLKEAKEAIPEAWEELVCSEDDFLLELLSKSVEKNAELSLTGRI